MRPTEPDDRDDPQERTEQVVAPPSDTGADERTDAEREAAEFGGE
ncbi:hypothetical protein ACU61A_35005 [Pseudonocardia sichuanensis]